MKRDGNFFQGFTPTTHTSNYTYAGCRIHKPEFGYGCSDFLSAEFIDVKTGKVTDKFYGTLNDFNYTFAALASQGKKFDVILHEKWESEKINNPYDEEGEFIDYVATKYGTCEQQEDSSWKIVDIEPVRCIFGTTYVFMNLSAYKNYTDEEKEIMIQKAIDADLIW